MTPSLALGPLKYDPVTDLRHYPISLTKYGLNPYGQPLFRIVFAESRRNLVGGKWPDGSIEYRWEPTYDQVKEPWVMEKWLSAWDFTLCTKRTWDLTHVDPASGWLLLGPYPDRGEYQHCHTFTAAVADCNIDKLVMWINEGRNRSWQDNRDANKKQYEAEEKETRQMIRDVSEERMPAFLDKPMSGRVSRGSKTAKIMLTADQVRLPGGRMAPTSGGKFVSGRPGSKRFQVPIESR